jgi:hypothetical protein
MASLSESDESALASLLCEGTALAVTRGVLRLFARHDIFGVPEVPLPNGRRLDIMAVDARGSIIAVEIIPHPHGSPTASSTSRPIASTAISRRQARRPGRDHLGSPTTSAGRGAAPLHLSRAPCRGLPLRQCAEGQGVKKGDRVTIYMPMIPEAAFAMLACARIGAIHSVVFGGFSPEALAGRIRIATAAS